MTAWLASAGIAGIAIGFAASYAFAELLFDFDTADLDETTRARLDRDGSGQVDDQ